MTLLQTYAAISRCAELLLDAQTRVRYFSGAAGYTVQVESGYLDALVDREHAAERELRTLIRDAGLPYPGTLPPIRTADGRLLLIRVTHSGPGLWRAIVEQLAEVIDLAAAVEDARPLGPGERRAARRVRNVATGSGLELVEGVGG